MHIFSIKASCKLCNNNLDLLSFKSRYMFKDGWLCKSCYKKYNINNYNSKMLISNVIKKDINKNKIIFNVAGTTFNNEDGSNRQDIIEKIVNNGIKNEYLIPYNGLTIKDMKQDYYDRLYYVDGQELSDIKFKEKNIKNEKAIMILLNDFNDNYVEVGYVPKNKIEEISTIIKNNDYKVRCFIRGGKYKEIEYYDEDYQYKEEIIENDLIYGLEIKITDNKKSPC